MRRAGICTSCKRRDEGYVKVTIVLLLDAGWRAAQALG